MSRPILARIDTQAFRHNYLMCKQLAPHSRAWAVVKANAYGHGILRCAHAIKDVADGFALLEVAEATALRGAGFSQPILLLEGVFDEVDLVAASAHSLDVVIHHDEQLRMLELSELDQPVNVLVKLNSGMNRLGFRPEMLRSVLERLHATGKARAVTLMTHFACADGAGIEEQYAVFRTAAEGTGLPCCVANSAALLRFPEVHHEAVRPGIVLYGSSPMPEIRGAADLGLRPVMTLASQIIGVQRIRAGERVGYAASFTADREMLIGVVACGYADGYPRHAGTGTPILVGGHRTRTLGRVSMDMLACDLTDLPGVGVGSSVTLWGEGLPADDVASAAGTISYELYCALAQRVPVVTC